ncbi:MAG: class II glutamine amidotransferase, partial [Marinoscillum sp.]
MCRFTFYQGRPIRIGSLITEPDHSLINQSFNALERDEPLNGDGFGLAWYNHLITPIPAFFKSVTPAWNNRNLLELSRITESTCIMAHVRAATQGLLVAETNCHPFGFRQYAFMHNGDIGGFHKIRRKIVQSLSDDAFESLKGSTDSEHFFCLLQDELKNREGLEPHDQMSSSLMTTIRRIMKIIKDSGVEEHSYMNMVLTNGHLAVAVRFTTDEPKNADSLYLNIGRKYVCEEGVCSMIDPGDHEKAVIISSEPLSTDPGWESIPVNSMIVVKEGRVYDRLTIT